MSGSGFGQVSTVAFSGIEAKRVDVQVQISGGRHSFTVVGLPDKAVGESRERVRGALQRLNDFGHTAHLVKGAFDYVSGGAGLKALMTVTEGRIDALICANDLMAIGAVDCARTVFGLSVPSDLSVVGFDGVAPAFWTNYQISTIRQPVRRMTEAAVAMVIERIDDSSLAPEVRSFAGDFVAGASARLAPID